LNILINAVSLSTRGGASVVMEFIRDIKKQDTEDRFIFLVSDKLDISMETNSKINIIGISKKELRDTVGNLQMKIDACINLQNTILPLNTRQFLLIHQAIPFTNISLNDLGFKLFFKYKVLLNLYWHFKVRCLEGIFVQSAAMKSSVNEKYRFPLNKIHVIRPSVKTSIQKPININSNMNINIDKSKFSLIYVSSSDKYKNNERLIQAIDSYNLKNNKKVMLYLTIEGNDSENIKYLGKLQPEVLNQLYPLMEGLVFPSLIETVGLPIIEAMNYNLPILVADKPYSRELLNPEEAIFFNPNSIDKIEDGLREFIEKLNKGNYIQNYSYLNKGQSYLDYIKVIKNKG